MYIHTLIINDLKAVFYSLIFYLLFLTPFASIQAQTFELLVYPKDSANSTVLKSIPYINIHNSHEGLLKEAANISKKLAIIGFINNSYHLNKKDTTYTCIYTLNTKIDSIRVYYSSKFIDSAILKKITTNYTNTYFEIATNTIENVLNYIVDYFENKSASFTTASLINLSQQENKLTAELQLNISEERKINSIVIKGYNNFPKKYLKHYLNLKPNSSFTLNTLNKVHLLINTIPFVTQLKQPEVLFTKDSTTLYIYLKKKATSKFDGIIGFSNKENSNKLSFNGYLNLNLNNIFNKGESFGLNWKNNGGNTQTLNLEFETPYLFNTRFSTSGDFSIFKQDSMYVNTKSQLKVNYSINRNNFINAMLSNENSNLTSLTNTLGTINEFKSSFAGLSYTFKILSNLPQFNEPKFILNAGYQIGNRIADRIKSNQAKIQLSASYNFEINYKNSIFIKNTNEVLNSSKILQNELFRIGGTTSIRGFDEQSIFTSKYSVTTLEYHYSISQTSHTYTITDVAFLSNNLTNSTTKLYGIGLGYYFNTKFSIINLSYAIGKNYKIPINLNNSKIHIKITYLF